MLQAKEQSLLDAMEPMAAEHGIEIVTVEVVGAKKSPVIRIYIDAKGGVTFNELTEAQEWMGAMLDDINPFPGAYMLEVSSPGIDRPLRTPEHFAKAVGQEAKVKLLEALDGRKHFKGVIESADTGSVALDVDGTRFDLPYDNISKANIIGTVEF